MARIPINIAVIDDLLVIPGISTITARNILKLRDQLGHDLVKEDLMNKFQGVTKQVLDQLDFRTASSFQHGKPGSANFEEDSDNQFVFLPRNPKAGGCKRTIQGLEQGIGGKKQRLHCHSSEKQFVSQESSGSCSINFQQQTEVKGKFRNRMTCPVPECGLETRTLARHVRSCHLPPPFRLEISNKLHVQRLAALELLARWIGGQKATLQLLVGLVHGRIPYQSAPVSEGYIELFRAFCSFNGWKMPTSFDLQHPSSPAMLLHWRLLLALICLLSEQQRNQFAQLFPEDPETERPVQTTCTLSEHQEVLPPPIEIVDAHFHLDWTAKLMQLDVSHSSLADILDVNQLPAPEVPVKIVGGVMVFCDPDHLPHGVPQEAGFRCAFGVSPREASRFTTAVEEHLWSLLGMCIDNPLGEVGLDWTEPRHTWEVQEEVLRKILGRCCRYRPLVLHIRDVKGSWVAYYRALEILRESCGYLQPIHLHGFAGTVEVAKAWSTAFPRTLFGFTGEVFWFDQSQLAALIYLPLQNILLETDSPYLSPHPSVEVNTPAYIGDIARFIAQAKNMDLRTLVQAANENARRFYHM